MSRKSRPSTPTIRSPVQAVLKSPSLHRRKAYCLMSEGVTVGYQLHMASPFREDTRRPLYHNCQTWGHKAYTCHRSQHCPHCEGGHAPASCPTPEAERRCSNCNDAHPAYNRDCPFSKDARERPMTVQAAQATQAMQETPSATEPPNGPRETLAESADVPTPKASNPPPP